MASYVPGLRSLCQRRRLSRIMVRMDMDIWMDRNAEGTATASTWLASLGYDRYIYYYCRLLLLCHSGVVSIRLVRRKEDTPLVRSYLSKGGDKIDAHLSTTSWRVSFLRCPITYYAEDSPYSARLVLQSSAERRVFVWFSQSSSFSIFFEIVQNER